MDKQEPTRPERTSTRQELADHRARLARALGADPAGTTTPPLHRLDDQTDPDDVTAELLDATAGALDAAVDLEQPRRTTQRTLTVQTVLQVAVVHSSRRGWAVERLRHLARQWSPS